MYIDIKTEEDSDILQQELSALQAWEKANVMEFHPKKSQILRITKKTQPNPGTAQHQWYPPMCCHLCKLPLNIFRLYA